MANRLIHESDSSVSTQEAQEVMAYFERQRTQDVHTTAQDIAEAISVPVSEVEAVIAQLRNRQAVPPRQKRAKSHRGLIFAAVVAWLTIVGGAISFAYWSGKMSGRNEGYSSYLYGPTRSLGNGRILVDTKGGIEKYMPADVAFSFQGYEMTGTGGSYISEDLIRESLIATVDKVARAGHDSYGSTSVNRNVLRLALLNNEAGSLRDNLQFVDFTITKYSQRVTIKIPLEVDMNYEGAEIVREERERRLAIAANQIVRLGKPVPTK